MKSWLKSARQHPGAAVVRLLVYAAAVVTALVLVCILAFILWKGIPNLKPELFAWRYTSDNCSMLPAILNTITMTALALAVSVPLGVGSAIYLVEYAKRGSRLVKVVRMTTETLSGIPSIVYGLFGYLMFGITLHLGYSMLSGVLTLSIMVLPTIMRTTEEVPRAWCWQRAALRARRRR